MQKNAIGWQPFKKGCHPYPSRGGILPKQRGLFGEDGVGPDGPGVVVVAFGAVGFEFEYINGGDVEGGAVFLVDAQGVGLIEDLAVADDGEACGALDVSEVADAEGGGKGFPLFVQLEHVGGGGVGVEAFFVDVFLEGQEEKVEGFGVEVVTGDGAVANAGFLPFGVRQVEGVALVVTGGDGGAWMKDVGQDGAQSFLLGGFCVLLEYLVELFDVNAVVAGVVLQGGYATVVDRHELGLGGYGAVGEEVHQSYGVDALGELSEIDGG